MAASMENRTLSVQTSTNSKVQVQSNQLLALYVRRLGLRQVQINDKLHCDILSPSDNLTVHQLLRLSFNVGASPTALGTPAYVSCCYTFKICYRIGYVIIRPTCTVACVLRLVDEALTKQINPILKLLESSSIHFPNKGNRLFYEKHQCWPYISLNFCKLKSRIHQKYYCDSFLEYFIGKVEFNIFSS